MGKRIVSALFSCILAIGLIPAIALADEPATPDDEVLLEPQLNIVDMGYWGDCEWRLWDDGSLVVIGPGAGEDTTTCPWLSNASAIKEIKMIDGVELPEECEFLFAGLTNVTSIDLSGCYPYNVTSLYAAFAGCSKLTSVDFGDAFYMPNLENMGYMFQGCTALKTLDFSSIECWPDYLGWMLEGCTALETVDFGYISTVDAVMNGGEAARIFVNNPGVSCYPNLKQIEVGSEFVTDGTYPDFPSESVNGHTDWYCSPNGLWQTSAQILSDRNHYSSLDATSFDATYFKEAKEDIEYAIYSTYPVEMYYTGNNHPGVTLELEWVTGDALVQDTHYRITSYEYLTPYDGFMTVYPDSPATNFTETGAYRINIEGLAPYFTGTGEGWFFINGNELDVKFPDLVGDYSWYRHAAFSTCDTRLIDYASTTGLVNGKNTASGVVLAPRDNVTRAEFITMIWNAAGKPAPSVSTTFTDLDSTRFYYEAVTWAQERGVVNGYPDNTFRPNNLITRQELATMISNYANKCASIDTAWVGQYVDLSDWTDGNTVSPWAQTGVKYLCYVGSMGGAPQLNPSGNANRAETIKMLSVFFHDVLGRRSGVVHGMG